MNPFPVMSAPILAPVEGTPIVALDPQVEPKKEENPASGEHNTKPEVKLDSDSANPQDLFVGNLSLYTTEDKLRVLFGRFGVITDARIMTHADSNKSRRFGFVTFQEAESVQSALVSTAKGEINLDGKTLITKPAIKKIKDENAAEDQRPVGGGPTRGRISTRPAPVQAGGRPSKVFVGGVSQEVTQADLRAYFSKFGPLHSAVLLQDLDTGNHRGFGFVTFMEDAPGRLVVQQKFHVIKDKVVEVKPATHGTGDVPKGSSVKMPSMMAMPPIAAPASATNPFQLMMSQALSTAFYSLQQSLQGQFSMQQQQAPAQPQQQQPRIYHSSSRFTPYSAGFPPPAASSATVSAPVAAPAITAAQPTTAQYPYTMLPMAGLLPTPMPAAPTLAQHVSQAQAHAQAHAQVQAQQQQFLQFQQYWYNVADANNNAAGRKANDQNDQTPQ